MTSQNRSKPDDGTEARLRNMPVTIYHELSVVTQSLYHHFGGDFETDVEHMESLARDMLANLKELRRYRESRQSYASRDSIEPPHLL